MNKQNLATYRKRLLDAGIHRDLVQRHLRELQDHWQDLLEQGRAQGLAADEAASVAASKIGSMEELQAAMLGRRELLNSAHRHPWLATLVLPLCTLLVFIAIVFLLVYVFAELCGLGGAVSTAIAPAWLLQFAHLSEQFLLYALVPLLASALVAFAIRQHLAPRYWAVTAFALCVLGSILTVRLQVPDPANAVQGVIGLGLHMLSSTDRLLDGGNFLLLRAVGNVLCCSIAAWYCLRREGQALTSHLSS